MTPTPCDNFGYDVLYDFQAPWWPRATAHGTCVYTVFNYPAILVWIIERLIETNHDQRAISVESSQSLRKSSTGSYFATSLSKLVRLLHGHRTAYTLRLCGNHLMLVRYVYGLRLTFFYNLYNCSIQNRSGCDARESVRYSYGCRHLNTEALLKWRHVQCRHTTGQ